MGMTTLEMEFALTQITRDLRMMRLTLIAMSLVLITMAVLK
jgi:hypothetical protein